MGADDGEEPTDTSNGNGGGRRAKRREAKERKRADAEAKRAAEREDQYREDRDAEESATEAGNSPEKRMRRALTAVRREGYKVALIYAAVDAVLAALVVNLFVQVLNPGWLPTTLPWPGVVADAISGPGGSPVPPQTSIVVGVVVGLVVLGSELLVRTRRPFVEQFEGANPEIREALRTARDAVRSGKESRMTVALYEEVLARLRSTSSVGLVNVKRVLLTVIVISAVSVASIQVAVVGLDIGDLRGEEEGDDLDQRTSDYEGLQDASDVLGDPEDVTAGEEELNTTISTTGGGDDGSTSAASAYNSGGFAGSGDVEGQEAGFAEREQLEDAELIREYNLQIRAEDDSDT
ncbi:DUF7502 family protein [Salinigranum sp. GCM10025319]|uniref:DUF7502 family protein n=1 Tax=Salinigranum sp. GCM10025319 TaxID=3252687 RepID=UPI00361D6A59